VPVAQVKPDAARDAALKEYGDAVVSVFTDLFWRTLQGLKDCACGHLLRDCPDMTYAPVPLALVTIRDSKVYHICNFGARQEVVTFPKLGYWLSAVPVVQLVAAAAAEFCCLVLPALRESKRGGRAAQFGLLAAKTIEGFVAGPAEFVQHFDKAARGVKATAQSPLLTSILQQAAPKLASLVTQRGVFAFEHVGQDAKTAAVDLGNKGLEVTEASAPYSTEGRNVLRDIAGALTVFAPGDKVEVYTDAGKVVHIERVNRREDAKGTAESAEVRRLKADITALQNELQKLQQQHGRTEKAVADGAAEVASLRAKMGGIRGRRTPSESDKPRE